MLAGMMLVATPVGVCADGTARSDRRHATKQQERAADLMAEREAQALREAGDLLKTLAANAADPAKMESVVEEFARSRAEFDLRKCLARWVANRSSEFERQQAEQPIVPGNPVREVDVLHAAVLDVRKVERVPGWMRVRVEGGAVLTVAGAYGRSYELHKLAFAAVYEIQPDWSGIKLSELTLDGIAAPID